MAFGHSIYTSSYVNATSVMCILVPMATTACSPHHKEEQIVRELLQTLNGKGATWPQDAVFHNVVWSAMRPYVIRSADLQCRDPPGRCGTSCSSRTLHTIDPYHSTFHPCIILDTMRNRCLRSVQITFTLSFRAKCVCHCDRRSADASVRLQIRLKDSCELHSCKVLSE